MSDSLLNRLHEPKVKTISLICSATDKILKIIINFWDIKRNKQKPKVKKESKYILYFTFMTNLIIWMNRLGPTLKTCPTPWTQDLNWTYISRSENVLDVFWTSYVSSIYVLYPLCKLMQRHWVKCVLQYSCRGALGPCQTSTVELFCENI